MLCPLPALTLWRWLMRTRCGCCVPLLAHYLRLDELFKALLIAHMGGPAVLVVQPSG